MEKINLSLTRLTFAQKLALMEALWADIADDENIVESPIWHEAVLKDRELALATGKTGFSDWAESKKRIQNYSNYYLD